MPFFGINPYLCPQIWFSVPRAGEEMKRESGANPGQSRCCEAPRRFRTSQPLIRKGREGFGTGVSQKTCQVDSMSKDPEGWAFDFGGVLPDIFVSPARLQVAPFTGRKRAE